MRTPADLEALAAAALADEPRAPTPARDQATIEFKCYYCDAQVRVSADLAGKQTPCPECRRIIKVPLLETKQPKDWRKVQARLPAGARRDVGPVPEGAWDTASVGVSRQALVEAQAIPQARPRLTVAQWIKRGTAVAASILMVGGVAWMVTRFLALNRQDQTFAKALQYLGAADKLSSEAAAEIHRGAGEYYVRTLKRGCAEEARNHFQQARAAIVQSGKIDSVERESLLIELALTQVELGGDKTEIEAEKRLSWDDAHKEIRRTLQNLTSPESQGEALHQLTRKLLGKNQGMRAAALASLFPEEGPELAAVVGLEMLRAKQEQMAETLANQALEKLAPQAQAQGVEAKPPALAPAPSLIALWLALGKPDKAAAATPAAEAGKERDPAVLVGTVAGLAYQGNFDQARQLLRSVSAPEERLPALIGLAAAIDNQQAAAAARSELENAFSLVEGEFKAHPPSPWQLVRLARAGAKAGLDDRVQATARIVTDAAARGRMHLEILRGRLARSAGPADDSWIQIVDANTPAHSQALELLARHNARCGAAAAMQNTVETWEENLQPFGYLGIALGLQERDQ